MNDTELLDLVSTGNLHACDEMRRRLEHLRWVECLYLGRLGTEEVQMRKLIETSKGVNNA
jgi:hypothetical protein